MIWLAVPSTCMQACRQELEWISTSFAKKNMLVPLSSLSGGCRQHTRSFKADLCLLTFCCWSFKNQHSLKPVADLVVLLVLSCYGIKSCLLSQERVWGNKCCLAAFFLSSSDHRGCPFEISLLNAAADWTALEFVDSDNQAEDAILVSSAASCIRDDAHSLGTTLLKKSMVAQDHDDWFIHSMIP